MKFVIFHGSFGSPKENWIPDLRKNLESLNQNVIAPQFPVDNWEDISRDGPFKAPKKQNLQSWLRTFQASIIPEIKEDKKLCFIGHSLSPVFILHIIDKYQILLDSAIFVSPFMRSLNLKDLWQFDHVNKSFYKTDFEARKLRKLIPVSYVLYSDNDPYVGREYSEEFARILDSELILIHKGGHFNSEAGWLKFPRVLDLCKKRILNISK